MEFIESPLFTRLLDEYLATIYDKDEAKDLTPDQRRMLKAAIDREKQECAHATRRRR